MEVYCVFKTYGSGDSDTEFFLESICGNLEKAKKEAKRIVDECHLVENKFSPIHSSMTEDNPVFVGRKNECEMDCPYSTFGGMVIEKAEVLF
jgi:hypothetical protein